MDNNSFQSTMSDIDLMKSFIENASTQIRSSKNAFIEYGVHLPLGDNKNADTDRIDQLNALLEREGVNIVEFRAEQSYSDLSHHQVIQMDQGKGYGNLTANREFFESCKAKYMEKHGLENLTLEEYVDHSKRPAFLGIQYNLHAQDLSHIINTFRGQIEHNKKTTENTTEAKATLEI